MFEDGAGTPDHCGRQAGQLGHLDAVAPRGPAGHQLAEEDHLLAHLAHASNHPLSHTIHLGNERFDALAHQPARLNAFLPKRLHALL